MRIHDITRPLSAETAPWPGDEPFALQWSLRLREGASVNLTWFRTSPHVGTHTDAPLHVREGAESIERADLAAYLGPARVLVVEPGPDGLIGPACLEGFDVRATPRLLFRTGTDPDPTRFPHGFAAFAPETCRRAAELGAVLLGIDTPSVDPEDSSDLAAHHALLDGGLRWLENLDLSRVAAGVYELVALPLPLAGACASPVRAVLLERWDGAIHSA